MSTHYLSNKNLIAEIAKSKNSYCWFASPDFATPTRYTNSLYGPHKEGCDPFQEGEIVRVYTFDHVPASTITNRSRDHGARGKAPVNFPPFRQYHVRDGELVEVGRSHWKGDLATGRSRPPIGQAISASSSRRSATGCLIRTDGRSSRIAR